MLKKKAELYAECGLNSDGTPVSDDQFEDADQHAEALRKMTRDFEEQFDFDPTLQHVFSRDWMRVDVGLMIQRPPIFLRMRQNEIDFIKDRQAVMAEYFCDTREFIDEFNEVASLNEDVLALNPYVSRMNIDNYPTHKWTNPETGEEETYCAASKQWSRVDPACTDNKSLHYAGEDRTFLIVKNKYTGDWEFPVSKLNFGMTFFRAKYNLFKHLTDDKWRIKFLGSSPNLATIREFTDIEAKEPLNAGMKGVRTYFFGAHHLRGIPEMHIDKTDYDDWAWVPKRHINKFFTKENYEVFIHTLKTR